MKYILSLIISGALVVSGFGQTRNVLVGTNNAVVQPTNFWSADASNARTGLGLGTAATSPVSAFQPASSALSNLATGNGGALSNLQATNLVGIIPASNISTVTFTNIGGTLAISSGGTGATNAANARQNLGSTIVGDAVFIATNAAAARTAIGALATDGNAINLTNFPTLLLRTNGSGAGLTDITAANISGSVAIANGGTGATNAETARTNLGLGWSALTNTDATNFRNAIGLGTTNNAFTGLSVGTFNTNLSTDNSSAFGGQNFIDSTASVSFAFGGANTITNMPIGSGGSIVMGLLGNMRHQGAFLFNGVPQGGTAGSSRGNNTFAVNASNGIYLNGPLLFEGVSTVGRGLLEINSGGTVSKVVTNISTATPAFVGWDGFSYTAFGAGTARTNLGVPWAGLTNTNAATFQAALFGSNTNPVLVNTNGEVVSPTNFWQVAPISTTVQYQTNITGTSTNPATNSRNLFLFSLSPSVSGVTNTVTLPTNPATTFEGDRATIIHLAQSTNAVTAIRQLGAATNLITLNQLDETVLLMYRSGAWILADNISYVEPIFFSGTNAAANAAASRTNLGLGASNNVVFNQVNASDLSGDNLTLEGAIYFTETITNIAVTRTNLGLGLPALTNTNNANFQAAVFATNSNPTNAGNFNNYVAWMEVTVQTNGSNVSFRVPLYK
jgi:hypothetical protein